MCQSFTNRKCGWNNLWVSSHEKFENGKKVYRALQLERFRDTSNTHGLLAIDQALSSRDHLGSEGWPAMDVPKASPQ